MVVSINGSVREMSSNDFKKLVKAIKKMVPKRPTILAIVKDNYAEMRKDVYDSQNELTDAIHIWNEQGYEVKYTRGL